MEQDIKREAFRQYLHYFRFWFAGIGVMAVILFGILLVKNLRVSGRRNSEAPTERVYDFAEKLTDEEEEKLRAYIAKQEKRYKMDIVLVTIEEDVEQYGYWDRAMMNYADDFYDELKYGYDKVHGDGVLLLDNWYEGQKGSWFSTCGRLVDNFSQSDTNRILDVVYEQADTDPFEAYMAYVKEAGRLSGTFVPIPLQAILMIPIIAAAFFAVIHMKQKKAVDTTAATAFVENGKPSRSDNRDEFIRKSVSSVIIRTSSSGGSSGGGSHRSSGGVRHGGGGRRR